MNFSDAMESVKDTVNKRLIDFFKEKRTSAENLDSHCVVLVDAIDGLTMRGGKRSRPFLCWLGSLPNDMRQMAGDGIDISKSLMSVMAALELFQTFALIHDDIIDGDTERRGGLTVHAHFQKMAQNFGNPLDSRNQMRQTHFGQSMAILAGDMALVWADELMQGAPRIISGLWNTMKEEVVFGQTLDVLSIQAGKPITKSKIDELKTARYSFIRPLQLGAMLSGAPNGFLRKLEAFGLPVGLLFQLRDDLLDGDIFEESFRRQIVPLKMQSEEALNALELNAGARALFVSLLSFVIGRTS